MAKERSEGEVSIATREYYIADEAFRQANNTSKRMSWKAKREAARVKLVAARAVYKLCAEGMMHYGDGYSGVGGERNSEGDGYGYPN